MIAQITGKIISKKTTEVVVLCSGIGFLLSSPISTMEKLPDIGQTVTLQTLLIPKEDAMLLFGFYTDQEREIFKLLMTISGIGPKSALGILSSISIPEFCSAINTNNLALLKKMPGIGSKTAERILVELRDKLPNFEQTESVGEHEDILSIAQDAVNALVTLGFLRAKADKEVRQVLKENDNNLTIEQIISIVLQKNKH